jgi:Tfp pilus assembly protein PilO
MGARNADRVWLYAGPAVIVLLAAATWFVLIGPKYTEASEVRAQVDDTQTQLISLRRKISDLDRQKAQLPRFKAALKVNQQALPSDSGVPDFLRQLQAAGDKVGVSVTGVTVAAPVKSTAATDVWELPMTLTADGDADKLSLFLIQLQNVQPRAVLVKSANLTQGDDSSAGSDSSQSSLSIAITAYVQPPAGSGAPIVTTK